MTWRIDLTQTQPHWRGWFEGLSSLFLSVSAPKLLVLAGVDRLDKDLTVNFRKFEEQTSLGIIYKPNSHEHLIETMDF